MQRNAGNDRRSSVAREGAALYACQRVTYTGYLAYAFEEREDCFAYIESFFGRFAGAGTGRRACGDLCTGCVARRTTGYSAGRKTISTDLIDANGIGTILQGV